MSDVSLDYIYTLIRAQIANFTLIVLLHNEVNQPKCVIYSKRSEQVGWFGMRTNIQLLSSYWMQNFLPKEIKCYKLSCFLLFL